MFRSLSDREDPGLRARALQLQDKVASQFGGDIEEAIRTLAERYIEEGYVSERSSGFRFRLAFPPASYSVIGSSGKGPSSGLLACVVSPRSPETCPDW